VRIAQLEALRAELRRMIDACAGGKVAECRILEGVGDHGLCLHDRHDPPDRIHGGVHRAAE